MSNTGVSRDRFLTQDRVTDEQTVFKDIITDEQIYLDRITDEQTCKLSITELRKTKRFTTKRGGYEDCVFSTRNPGLDFLEYQQEFPRELQPIAGTLHLSLYGILLNMYYV